MKIIKLTPYSFDGTHIGNIVEVSKKVPKGVICLISALAFHELTTQTPHYVWLAVDRKARKPKIDYPPVRVFFFSGDAFNRRLKPIGIQSTTFEFIMRQNRY